MKIPVEHTSRFVYHFTHLDNLAGILEHGILSTNEMIRLNLEYANIAYDEIQDRRSKMTVTCGGGCKIHDYVPLYFCKRSPMLYANVTKKMVDEQFIIYFEFPIAIMLLNKFVFTDASANTNIPPKFYDDPKDLDKINWEAVETWRWGSQYDKFGGTPVRQAKMAELLIFKKVDVAEAKRIIVWDKIIAKLVVQAYERHKLAPPPIEVERDFYFVEKESLPPVTGPFMIKRRYEKTVSLILKDFRANQNKRFRSLAELCQALRLDMHALPETGELVGLESDNYMHKEDVAAHSQRVVSLLARFPEYQQLSPADRLLTELAAFLHDIGKGPKSRWPTGKQKVDPDHPVKAIPMLKRILLEDVGNLTERDVKILCKLVCYHDLIGDIIGNGRRAQELEAIIEDETELSMLIALSRADITAIRATWLVEDEIQKLRERVSAALRSPKK